MGAPSTTSSPRGCVTSQSPWWETIPSHLDFLLKGLNRAFLSNSLVCILSFLPFVLGSLSCTCELCTLTLTYHTCSSRVPGLLVFIIKLRSACRCPCFTVSKSGNPLQRCCDRQSHFLFVCSLT